MKARTRPRRTTRREVRGPIAGPPIGPGLPVAEALPALISGAVGRIGTEEPAARRFEPEGIHRLRTAVRRLRGLLHAARSLLEPDEAATAAAELRGFLAALGAVRDLDVLADRLREAAVRLDLPDGLPAPILDELARRQAAVRGDLLTALDARAGLGTLGQALPAVAGEAAGRPCREALPPLLDDAWRRLRKAARRLDDANGRDDRDDRLHRVRVLAKRARHAAEAFAPGLDPDAEAAALAFARRAADLQDILGEHQDAVVARRFLDEVRDAVEAGPDREAVDALARDERRAARRARRRVPDAWARLDRKRLRAWG